VTDESRGLAFQLRYLLVFVYCSTMTNRLVARLAWLAVAFTVVLCSAATASATLLSLPDGFKPVEDTQFAGNKSPGAAQHHVLIQDGQVEAEIVQSTIDSKAAVIDTARSLASTAKQSGFAQDVVINTSPAPDNEIATLRFTAPQADFDSVAFVFRDGSKVSSARLSARHGMLPDLEAHLLRQIRTIARRPAAGSSKSSTPPSATFWGSLALGSFITMWALKKRKQTQDELAAKRSATQQRD